MTPGVLIVGPVDRRLEEIVRSCGLKPSILAAGLDLLSLSDPTTTRPDLVLVDVRGSLHVPPAISTLKLRHPDIPVVLVASALDPVLMLEAMRAGINECVAEPLTTSAVGDAISRVLAMRGVEMGQVFAFVGAKGGVGATTLAVSVATTLAASGSALMMDLQPSFGDAAVLMSAEPRFS